MAASPAAPTGSASVTWRPRPATADPSRSWPTATASSSTSSPRRSTWPSITPSWHAAAPNGSCPSRATRPASSPSTPGWRRARSAARSPRRDAGPSLGNMASTEQPRWRGINHLALITTDMDRTVRFYQGVLGANLVATIGTPAFRHYFFEFGPELTVAFFEYRDAEIEPFAKPAGVPDRRAVQFAPVSFNLPDEHALEALQRRLKEHRCEVPEVVDHEVMRSIYFTDPDGIALEASWWVVDATGREPDYADEQLFGDPDPVVAVRELAAHGEVSMTPTTRLVNPDDEVRDPA